MVSLFSKTLWHPRRDWKQPSPGLKTWAEKRKELATDVHHTNCKWLLLQTFYHFVRVCPVVVFLVGASFLGAGTIFNTDGICLPNGDFAVYQDTYNRWAPSGLFQITLGFGTLAFSKVKVINIVWDVIVGRGGQAFLAYVSYQVYLKALLRLMQCNPVSYGTFEAITLQDGRLSALFTMSRDCMSNQGRRAKATVIWMVLSGAFVIAFPTLVSAMTGYSSNIQPFVAIDGNLAPFSDFLLVKYIIHDGSRIGLSDDHIVAAVPDTSGCTSLRGLNEDNDRCLTVNSWVANNATNPWCIDWTLIPADCMLEWRVSQYATTYGLPGSNFTNSTFSYGNHDFELPAPLLNISTYSLMYVCASSAFCGKSSADTEEIAAWCMPGTMVVGWPASDSLLPDPDNVAYTIPGSNTAYNLSQMQKNGRCQQLDTYQWGFSFLLLFVFMVFTAVWALGTYALWMDAYLNSRFERSSRDLGPLRAILDYAAAMKKDLGAHASQTTGNKALQTQIRLGGQRHMISYDPLDELDLPLSRLTEIKIWWEAFDVRARNNPERGPLMIWLLSLLLLIITTSIAHDTFKFLWVLPLCLTFGATMTILAGPPRRSRWAIFWVFALLGFPLLFIDAPKPEDKSRGEHKIGTAANASTDPWRPSNLRPAQTIEDIKKVPKTLYTVSPPSLSPARIPKEAECKMHK